MANISAPYRPTTRTEGAVGDIFTNTTTGDKFRCTDIYEIRTGKANYYYTWVRITPGGGNGSGGIFTDETTGDKYILKVNNGKLTMEEV